MTKDQKQLDFVAIGDVTTDAFIQLDAGANVSTDATTGKEKLCVNFGDKIEYEKVNIIHGVGNSGNAAISAKRLGLETALVTDIGTDSGGDNCLEAWQKDNLDTRYVRRHKEYPTHYHFVLRHGAERTILIHHQPWPYKLPIFDIPPKWLYFSSVGEHGLEYHHEIARYLQEHRETKLAFQPGTFQIKLGYEALKDLYAVTELFFCNKQEAQRILNTTEDDMVKLLTQFRSLGPKIAVITDGPNGAYAQSSEGTWSMPMYRDPKPPVDRTGAGDSFSSTVTAMLALGMSLPEALMRGPINSMSVVQYIGAQKGLLTRDAIESHLANAPEDYIIKQL